MDKLSTDQNEKWLLMKAELPKLTDLAGIFQGASTLDKQTIINKVFDSQLYYLKGVYRTPYIMPLFRHNTLILKEKNLLIYEKSEGSREQFPLGGAGGNAVEHLYHFIEILKKCG